MCSKSACLSFLLIYLLAFSITFLVLISFGYNKTKEHDRYFMNIQQNQNSTGYSDIQLQQQPCSTEYGNMIKYEVPGVSTHCRRSFSRSYYKGRCDRKKNYFDREFYGIGPQPISIVNGLYYCGKQSPVTFGELRNLDSNNSCPNKYKLCGKDSQEGVCYPDHVECPINDLQITYNQQVALVASGYKEQKVNDSSGKTLYVYTSNKAIDKTIPIDFTFGYQQMCVDPAEEVVPKPQMRYFEKDYEDECELKLGSYKVDDRYQPLFQINKLILFQENHADAVLKSKYDLYDSHDVNYNVTLFQRPILHFSEDCRDFFYGNQQEQGFDQMKSKQISHFFGFVVFFYIAFILIALISCCMLCANMSDPKSQTSYCTGVTILMVLVIIAFGMIIHIYKQSVKRNESVIKIDSLNCGDKIFNSLFDEAAVHSKKSNARFFVCMVLTAIAILLYIIYVCVYCVTKGKSKSKSSSDTHYESYDKPRKKSHTSSSSSDTDDQNIRAQQLYQQEMQYNNDPYQYENQEQNEYTPFYN